MASANHMHNARILRFLAVLAAVVVTIFIYASYSTNTALTPPPHMRTAVSGGAPPSAAYQQLVTALNATKANSSNSIEERSAAKAHSASVESAAQARHANTNAANGNGIHTPYTQLDKVYKKSSAGGGPASVRKPHREPTIDADAVADGGAGGAAVGVAEVVGASGSGVAASSGIGGAAASSDDIAAEESDMGGFLNNDVLEEQYVQNIENALGITNNSVAGAIVSPVSGPSSQQHLKEQQQQQQQPAQPQSGTQTNELSLGQQPKQQQKQNLQLINNNLNKIPDSDVLIPTSNLQKFIENADKILKNMTATPAVNSVADKNVAAAQVSEKEQKEKPLLLPPQPPQPQQKPQQQQQPKQQQIQPQENQIKQKSDKENEISVDAASADAADAADVALPPSVVMTIKRSSASASAVAVPPNTTKSKAAEAAPNVNVKSKATAKAAVDPTQGIPTREIYEAGHLNDEINIAQICPSEGADLRVLVLVTSAQDHVQARLSIRQTWGHYGIRRDVSIAFILGRTTNASVNQMLTKENYIYGDLIRGNFIDSYNNLTLKTISALEWVDDHCPRAKYVLKTDDDMFINMPRLLQFLDTHAKEKRVIFGRLAKKWKPIRNKKSKYYVSTGQFSAAIFPPFTTGPAYVLSSDIVHELYVRSLNEVYLKLEDVFTTGIVAQQLNIKRVHANEFLNRRISFNPCNLRKAVSVHMIKANEQFDLWRKLLDQNTRCK